MTLVDRIVQGAAISAWVKLRLWETGAALADERRPVLLAVGWILEQLDGENVHEWAAYLHEIHRCLRDARRTERTERRPS